MVIALCQIDTKVADFAANTAKILASLEIAGKHGADLAVFPELALCSYPPLDLLERQDFLDASEAALENLGSKIRELKTAPATVILGAVLPNPDKQGRAAQNCAVIFEKGKLVHTVAKQLLPTYDVFDEARYFEPGSLEKGLKPHYTAGKTKLGISVCEDAWFGELHLGRKIYSRDPAEALKGCDIAVNISASPFEMNKHERRHEQIASFGSRVGAPLVYVNQVGANDEILFDGASFILDAKGKPIFELPSFQECVGTYDFEKKTSSIVSLEGEKIVNADSRDPIAVLHSALVAGIRGYFTKTGFEKAVLGLSGGIDSAVVACLAAEALGPRNVIGVALPSQYSSSGSLADAETLAKNIGIELRVHSIKFLFSTLQMELKSSFQGKPADVTEENMQARLRAISLLAIANKRDALVLTTGNKSELAVGYCTTYGDMAGALGPLGDVYKTKVYELARFINAKAGAKAAIPESSITKAPSAELRPGQKDQDSLPPYDVLDSVLEAYFEGGQSAKSLETKAEGKGEVARILAMVARSEFKRRQAAPVLKITSKAFGLGRRMPVAKA